MITKALNEVLGDRVKVEILRFLLENPGEYSGRQVWRGIGVFSHTKVISALKELEATGQLKRRSAAPSYLFSINNANRFMEPLRALFDAEASVLDGACSRIREVVGEPLALVIVFGSVAGGRDVPGSDVDLILAVEDGAKTSALRAKVEEAVEAAEELAGLPIDYVLVERGELARKRLEAKRGMWADVFGDKPVILCEFKRGGKPVRRFVPQGRLLKV
jgi:predicted nucleotidyltransferase